MFFVAALQAAQDFDGLVDGRLGNIDFLESSLESTVLVEGFLVLAKCGGTDAA